jgi:hypothetical protein
MIHTTQHNVTKIGATREPSISVSSANSGTTRAASTKDAGRVHIGGGMMRFDTTKDSGRVHIGGGMMRF